MENITTQILEKGNLLISIPISLRSQRGRKCIIAPDTSPDHTNASILLALARGRRPASLRYAVTSWHPPSHFLLRRSFEKLIDDNQFTKPDKPKRGIRFLEGKTAAECAKILATVIPNLDNDTDSDYWQPTEGNAKKALVNLLMIAIAVPPTTPSARWRLEYSEACQRSGKSI